MSDGQIQRRHDENRKANRLLVVMCIDFGEGRWWWLWFLCLCWWAVVIILVVFGCFAAVGGSCCYSWSPWPWCISLGFLYYLLGRSFFRPLLLSSSCVLVVHACPKKFREKASRQLFKQLPHSGTRRLTLEAEHTFNILGLGPEYKKTGIPFEGS